MKKVLGYILAALSGFGVATGYTCPDMVTDVPNGYEPSRAPTSATLFFKPVTASMNFHDAHMNCLNDGGRLATFKTEEHLRDIEAIVDNDLTDDAWIGLFHVADYPLTCWDPSGTSCAAQLEWSDGTPYSYSPLSGMGTSIIANEQ